MRKLLLFIVTFAFAITGFSQNVDTRGKIKPYQKKESNRDNSFTWQKKVDPLLYFSSVSDERLLKTKSSKPQHRDLVTSIDGKKVSVIVEITPSTTLESFNLIDITMTTPSGRFVTGWVSLDNVDELAQLSNVEKIEASRIRSALNRNGREATGADVVHAGGDGLPQAYKGEGVIVGVLDSGIDFNSEDFKDDNGSRIQYLLDMRADDSNLEWTKAQIDANASQVTQRDGNGGGGHGTHVTGSAAGSGRMDSDFTGMAPASDIIFVKGIRDDDSNGGFADNDVLIGVDFIFDKAEEAGKPAVVNLSLGSNSGPLDGTSLYEQALTDLQGEGRIIVAAAGNEGFDYLHTGADMEAGKAYFSMDQIDDATEFRKEIWYENGAINAYLIGAFSESDGGYTLMGSSGWIDVGSSNFSDDHALLIQDDNRTIPAAYLWHYSVNTEDVNNGDGEIFLYINDGSLSQEPTIATPSNYYWGVFYSASSTGGRFDATNIDARGIIADVASNDAIFVPADRDHSLGSPASAKKVVSVGAFVTTNIWEAGDGNNYQSIYPRTWDYQETSRPEIGEIAYFSSRGPTRDGRLAPLVAAPGDKIFSVRSRHVDDDHFSETVLINNGDYVGSQGTSMASPHAAGAIALLLQANPNLDYDDIASIFANSSVKDSDTGSEANNIFGHGKLNVLNALKNVINTSVEEGIYPERAELHQNYPNPFNPTTVVSFTLNEMSDVKLEVFNVLGQKVIDLSPGIVNAGMHSYSVDASSLAGGVYMYRLSTANFSQTRMMTLVK